MRSSNLKSNKPNIYLGAGIIFTMSMALLILSCGICYAGMGSMEMSQLNPLVFRIGITELFILFIVPIIAMLLYGLKITFDQKVEERWFKGLAVAWLLNLVFMLTTSSEFLTDLKNQITLFM